MIEIRDLTYRYPDIEAPALRNLDLKIEKGEFVIVAGPSGSGKSTLLLLISGILQHFVGGRIHGALEIDGTDVRHLPPAQLASMMSVVLQDPERQLTNLWVEDEIAFGPENLLLPVEEVLLRLDQVIRSVGIEHLRDKFIFELSGGEKQRVAAAAGLAMNPDVLLLDNPTCNLDPLGSNHVCDLVTNLHNSFGNLTIIWAARKMGEVINCANRLLVLDGSGCLVLDGEPREILEKHEPFLREELGIFTPDMAYLYTLLKRKGYHLGALPLHLDEMKSYIMQAGVSVRSDLKLAEPSKLEDSTAASADACSIISCRDVNFSYSADGVPVLQGLSLEIKQGSLVALLGQNGAGKTTLAKILTGLFLHQSGNVNVCGVELNKGTAADMYKFVSYVFQNPEHQFVSATVYEDMAFGLRLRKEDENAIQRKVEEMLEEFQLTHVRDMSPYSISKGEQRRLSVASVLIMDPKVLILDEPATGQDYRNTEQLDHLSQSCLAKGVTILEITHDMDRVAKYASSAVVLNDQQVVFSGTPLDLFRQPELLHRCGLKEPVIAALRDTLQEEGYQGISDILTVETFGDLILEQ